MIYSKCWKQNKTKNKKKHCHPKTFNPEKLPFGLEEKIKKSLQDMKKLKEFIITIKWDFLRWNERMLVSKRKTYASKNPSGIGNCIVHACMHVYLVAQLCPTLCSAMDCSLTGSSVHGIFQARVLEWVAVSYCRRSSTQLYYSCKGGGLITFKASIKVKRQK